MIRQRKKTSKYFFLISIILTFGVLTYLLLREKEFLFSYQWQIQWQPFILSFVIYNIALLLTILKWTQILNIIGKKLPFIKHFRYYCISNVAKRLPGTIWYVASRVYLYQADDISPKITSFASGVELVVSITSSILVSLVVGINLVSNSHWSLTTVIGLLFLSSVLLHPASFDIYFRWLKVERIKIRYSTIIFWVIIDCFTWLTGGILLYSVGNIFIKIPIQNLGYMIGSFSSMQILSALVFFLPSNFGITEIGLSLFLSRILPSHFAVMIAIGLRILVTVYDIVWAIIAWGIKKL